MLGFYAGGERERERRGGGVVQRKGVVLQGVGVFRLRFAVDLDGEQLGIAVQD